MQLQDDAADLHQALIYWDGERFKIKNLSKTTRTRVNGKPIKQQNLGDGNSITLGRTVLVFRDREDPKRNRHGARS